MNRCTAIISAYKCKSWLEGRISNLLEQTEVPDIVAVVRYHSEEAKIIHGFIDKHIRNIMLIYTSGDPTVYEAWNLAIGRVDTKYINIANSDDRLANFAIREMCDELDNNPDIGLVYPDCNIVTELNGNVVGKFEWSEGDLLEGCHVGPCPTYRTDLHKLYGLYPEDYIVAGDYWYWLNLEYNGVKFKHINKPLCTFWDRRNRADIEPNLEFLQSNRTIFETAKAKYYWRAKYDQRKGI